MNTKKAIGITIILSIAVSLLLTSGAYAQSGVTFSDSSSGSSFRGEGSSASEGKACSSDDDPYVQKAKSVYLNGPGYDHQSDCGYISAHVGDPADTAVDPYMFVEVDCEDVDVSVDIKGADGWGWANAGISAMAVMAPYGDEAWVSADIWADAHADAGPGTARAKATAKADGRAHAELDASGYFYDTATLTADAEGVAWANAGSSNRGYPGVTHAWTRSGIHANADLGSLNEKAGLYSSSIHVEGVGPRSVARADSSAAGSASASGLLDDLGVVDRSEVDVEGMANTHVSVRGEADAGASARAGSINNVESLEDLWLYPYPVVIYDAELIDASWIDSDSYADVGGHRSSAKADGYVSASTHADGMTSKPDVQLDSDTYVSGSAGSHVSVVKEGNAESYAGAIALNVVDGYVAVWPIGVDVELDMLDVTGLGSYSSAEGLSPRTRVFTNDWVRAYTHADSSWYPSVPDVPTSAASTTNGRASQSIKGKGLGLATSAAGAGSIAATNVVDGCTLIAEDFAAVGEGTDVTATDGSRMYPVASLRCVWTSAWTSPSASAELTGGSGNSWLKPWKNAGDSTVSGEIYLDPVGTVETDVYKDLVVNPNYAYGYLAGNKPFSWPSRWLPLVP